MPRAGAPDCLIDQPLGDGVQLDVLGLADAGVPFERLVRTAAGAAADDADCLIDHRSAVQRALQSRRPLLGGGDNCALYTDTAAGPAN